MKQNNYINTNNCFFDKNTSKHFGLPLDDVPIYNISMLITSLQHMLHEDDDVCMLIMFKNNLDTRLMLHAFTQIKIRSSYNNLNMKNSRR